jgi:ankyrin
VNALGADQKTPLHVAAKFGQAEVARLLVDHKPNLAAKTRLGQKTALHLAAQEGFDEVACILIAAGAVVDSKDNVGWTPLIDAVVQDRPKVVRVLLKNGADPNTLTPWGSPLHIATRDGFKEVIEVLQEYKAKKVSQ